MSFRTLCRWCILVSMYKANQVPKLKNIGFILFPRFTLMDVAGPWEILSRLPGTRARLLTEHASPVVTDTGVELLPHASWTDCDDLDLVVVPGGPGQTEQMGNQALLDFLGRQAAQAQWITSVCTGSLLLGAAGLLQGYQATCHWAALPQLALFGATPRQERFVVDRNRVTGGGVTAGLDFALALTQEIWGEDVARTLALGIEYRPAPPFEGGHPESETPERIATLSSQLKAGWNRRLEASELAAARLAKTKRPLD